MGSKCDPAHVPDNSLLNTYVLERCYGIRGIHGLIPQSKLCGWRDQTVPHVP
jgi:hypothetical protein